ncbi:MAG: VIT domain-containing protein, partial [Deltaproteobacteria bacterium]
MKMGKKKKIEVSNALFYGRSEPRLRDPGVLLIVLALGTAIVLVLFSFVYPEVAKAGVSQAQVNEYPWQTKSGQLFFKKDDTSFTQAAMLKTEVEIDVIGIIVKAHVRQSFSNSSSNWMEGIYAFPLPEDAAVTDLRMEVGDRQLEGQVKERQAARKTYEKAKNEGKKTSLMEQQRPNIFTVSVANIGPGEK